MRARYLLRFDDLCPTMNWRAWRDIEALLVETGVAPILAVVPANGDPKLCVDAPDPTFWESVRRWQDRGWTIGLHGHTHQYTTADGGILGVNPQSEFAGVPPGRQRDKLTAALGIFAEQRVRADVWVAPGHSFDATTLRALRESGLTTVSDGFMPYPGRDAEGTTWVPQQLWRFRPAPPGVWTVCIHHNLWGPRDVAALRSDLSRYRDQMTSFEAVVQEYGERTLGFIDDLFGAAYRVVYALKNGRRLRPGAAPSGASPSGASRSGGA